MKYPGKIPHTIRLVTAAIWLLVLSLMSLPTDASAQGELAVIVRAGAISIRDGSIIPPFPRSGNWAELPGKSSDRHETRHFMYMVSGESPAIV